LNGAYTPTFTAGESRLQRGELPRDVQRPAVGVQDPQS
jgi:hypothetical protein